MTYQYLLDTNILSDLVRHPRGRLFQHIATVGEDSVCTGIVVACELRFGVSRSGSSRLAQQLERILEVLSVLPLEPPVDEHYAEIKRREHFEAAQANTALVRTEQRGLVVVRGCERS
jgi:tRNA(fMet)-specific endonuclease VapC